MTLPMMETVGSGMIAGCSTTLYFRRTTGTRYRYRYRVPVAWHREKRRTGRQHKRAEQLKQTTRMVLVCMHRLEIGQQLLVILRGTGGVSR
jgi:hypothetical protein